MGVGSLPGWLHCRRAHPLPVMLTRRRYAYPTAVVLTPPLLLLLFHHCCCRFTAAVVVHLPLLSHHRRVVPLSGLLAV